MEIKSRVKKYEKKREGIHELKSETSFTKQLFSNQEGEQAQTAYTPARERKSSEETYPSFEEPTTFKNEYLDSFIQEVKEYNLQKGNRRHEDTKIDILEQLNAKNNRTRYIEKEQTIYNDIEKVEEVDTSSTDIISEQIQELLSQSDDAHTNESVVADTLIASEVETPEIDEKLTQRINELEAKIEHTMELNSELLKHQEVSEEESNENLVEQTTQMKIEINEYKEKVSGLNKEVSSNNRLLNVIITIQVIALLGIIAAVVYWLMMGGII